MIDELPAWYVSMWRIGGLLLFLSALFILWYLPIGLSTHPTILGNLIYAIVVMIGSIALLYGLLNEKMWTPCVMACVNGFLIGPLYIYVSLFYFMSMTMHLIVGLLAFFVIGSLAFVAGKRVRRLVLAGLGIVIGCVFASLQFAEPPSTKPINDDVPNLDASLAQSESSYLPIARDGWVSLREKKYMIEMQPILRFRDHNQHGFWSIVGGNESRMYPDLSCRSMSSGLGISQGSFVDELGDYLIQRRFQNGVHHIQSWSALENSVYSHLNHCLVVNVIGHLSLTFSFSSNPEKRFPIRAQEPLTFASLNAEGQLEVLQCAEREKGPFTHLGDSRPSLKGEFLTLYDNGSPICHFYITDWLLQSSQSYSPTAGYGVAQNAMEILVNGEKDSSPVMLWFSFAGTSVGRGFQCVGYQPGVYRMDILFEWLVR